VVPAVHSSGTPQKSAAPRAAASAAPQNPDSPDSPDSPHGPRRRSPARGWRAALRRPWIALALALVVALLFLGYLQVSRTYSTNSDEANDLLMAWDMLHGNVLLHGWYLSDVSFYTTELPQYALLVFLFGLHPGTAHIAAAMTYTLVLVFAVLLARGKRADRGREGLARTLLTGGIVLAPQLGVGVFILLLSLGHIGTSVPLMLTFLVIDRLRPRWYIPVLVGLLLAWVLVADQLVLLAGIVPLAAVCLLRVVREIPAARRAASDAGWLRACARARWYELSLAVAALAAWPVASAVSRLLSASGGFVLHPIGYKLAPVGTWPKHARVSAEGLLAMFGAKPQGPAPELAFALLHLAGVGLVAWAVCRVARRFLSWPDMISQVLLVAMVVNVAAYVPSTLADATDLNAREFAVVLPFGAVLAGRTLAPVIVSRKPRLRSALAVPLLAGTLLAGYAASLGYAAAQAAAPAANSELAEFLAAHHLSYGVSGYWQSSIVTVQSGGAVTIRALLPGTLRPDLWEAKSSWYDPRAHRATFLVTDDQAGFFNHWMPDSAALAAYGPPARTYHVGPYTIMVWDKNLLAQGQAP
jgi:preprotein translocase subunit SecG